MPSAKDLIERSRSFETRADLAADLISRQHYREMASHYRTLAVEHRDIAPSLVPDHVIDTASPRTEDA